MASNLFFPFLLLISLTSPSRSPAISVGEEAAVLPCVKELLPCRPYLGESKPPSQCCLPLLSAMQKKVACLCAVFYSEPILKALNVTQEEALNLPLSCGGNVPDMGNCNDAGGYGNGGGGDGPMPSPPTPVPAPQPPATPTPPSNGSSSPSSASIGNSIVTAGLPFLYGGIASAAILALF